MRGLFMLLVIHYWIGDVQDCQGVSASEMTYIVSSGALNSTHSLTAKFKCISKQKQNLHLSLVIAWVTETNDMIMARSKPML